VGGGGGVALVPLSPLDLTPPPSPPCPPPRATIRFAALAARGLSFDLHANWHQLADAAAFLRRHPTVPVVVDHMGCPRMGDATDPGVMRTWREGIAALSTLPQVHLKASNFEFVRSRWLKDDVSVAAGRCSALSHAQCTDADQPPPPSILPRMRRQDAFTTAAGMLREVVTAFGPTRVMAASNYPVDRVTTGSASLVEVRGTREGAGGKRGAQEHAIGARRCTTACGAP
jgi:predicted TIM-barrel fold metal-dependent hydrolase